MRTFRSLICAGLAMMAVVVAAAMPAAASIAIEPGIHATVSIGEDYSVRAMDVHHDDLAVLPMKAMLADTTVVLRRSIEGVHGLLAGGSTVPVYSRIDPHIRC